MSDWSGEVSSVPIRKASPATLTRILGRARTRPRPTRARPPSSVFPDGGPRPHGPRARGDRAELERTLQLQELPTLPQARVLEPASSSSTGTGDAGVLRFEDGYAYAIRIESHNHPSAVEPYGGAATGIGGIPSGRPRGRGKADRAQRPSFLRPPRPRTRRPSPGREEPAVPCGGRHRRNPGLRQPRGRADRFGVRLL